MATFNYQVKIGGDFSAFESELKSAVKNAKARFNEINTEWSDVTIDIPVDKNLAANIKKQLSVIQKYAPDLEPRINTDNIQKMLNEYTQLKIAIDEKDSLKALDLIKSKFKEINDLYETSISKPNKNDFYDETEYNDMLAAYKAKIAERDDQVYNTLKDILDYSQTMLNHGVIDRQSFSEVMNSALLSNTEIFENIMQLADDKGLNLSGGKEIENLKAVIDALNQFSKFNETIAKVDTSSMKNAAEQKADSKATKKELKAQADAIEASKPKRKVVNSTKINADELSSQLEQRLNAYEETVKDTGLRFDINDDEIQNALTQIERLTKFFQEPQVLKATVSDEIYTELDKLSARIKEIFSIDNLISGKVEGDLDSAVAPIVGAITKIPSELTKYLSSIDANSLISSENSKGILNKDAFDSDNARAFLTSLINIEDVLNSIITSEKELNTVKDDKAFTFDSSSIENMTSAINTLIERLNVLMGLSVAPEEVANITKKLSNAQKSSKMTADTRKNYKDLNARIKKEASSDNVDVEKLQKLISTARQWLGLSESPSLNNIPTALTKINTINKRVATSTKVTVSELDEFNNVFAKYKANATNISKYSAKGTSSSYDFESLTENAKRLQIILKSLDGEALASATNKLSTFNDNSLESVVRNASNEIDKYRKKIESIPQMASDPSLTTGLTSLEDKLAILRSGTFDAGSINEMYQALRDFDSELDSFQIEKPKSELEEFNAIIKQFKNLAYSSISKKGFSNDSLNDINSLKIQIESIINELSKEAKDEADNTITSISQELLTKMKAVGTALYSEYSKNSAKFMPDFKKNADEFNNITQNIDTSGKINNLNDLITTFTTFQSKYNDFSDKLNLKANQVGNLTKLINIQKDLQEFYNNPKYSGIGLDLKGDIGKSLEKVTDLINAGVFSKKDVEDSNNVLLKYKGTIKSLGTTTNSVTAAWFKLTDMNARFIAQFFSFYDIIRYMREFLSVVIEVDSAIGELRKVSSETETRLNQSLQNAASIAKELGASISDVVSATADWARLGYGIDEAEELARVSQLYVNVGDNITIDEASESLISTLQGFQLASSEAESVIDKFNEVANNYAIDTAGIGEALQRSAASFYAANTDLSKAIALVTTANTVLQNPDTVGTTFKTLSARIRGATTELEDLGEETDEYTETTSKLRDLVKGLTDFDIMEDEDTYKDIYDILVGIGEKWNDLTDIERASLGEALAGKRNSNALYAVLQNIDLLKDVYETAENSSGSAAKEQENYAKTIQYSIDVFKASLQELGLNILNSQVVKSLIDSGTQLVQSFETAGNVLGPVVTILGNILNLVLKITATIGQNPVGAFFEIGALIKYATYLKAVALGKREEATATVEETVANEAETVSEEINTASKVKNTIATEELTLAEKIGASISTKFASATATVSKAIAGLSVASKVALGVTVLLGVIELFNELVGSTTTSTEELREQAEQSAEEVSELKSELSSLNSKIDELNSKDTLTLIEQDELDKLAEAKEQLETQLKLKQALADEDAKAAEKAAVKDYNKNTVTERNYDNNGEIVGKNTASAQEQLEYLIKSYQEAKQNYITALANGESIDSDIIRQYQQEMDEASKSATYIATLVSENSEGITGVTAEGKKILEEVSSVSTLYEAFMAEVNGTAIDSLSEAAKRLYLINKAQESSVGEDIISFIEHNLSESAIDNLLSLDGFTFDEVETLQDLKDLLAKVNNTVYSYTNFDVGSMFDESENKLSTTVTLADLQAEADVLNEVNEKLSEGGRLSVSTMKNIIDNYPEAEDALRRYMVGLLDEQALFEELQNIYAQDEEYYNAVLRTELANSEDFMQAILDGNVELYNAIKDVYGEDYTRFKSLAEMKLDLEQNLIHSLLRAWAGYADVMSNMTDGLTYEQYESQLQAQVDSKEISEEMMAEYLLAWSDTASKYTTLQNKINEALNTTANYDLPDTSWQTLSSTSSDSSSSSSETESQFDWIERVINRISIAYNRLKTTVEDATDSWLNRNNALESSISALSEEIIAQQNAYSYYMSLFNGVGISDYYKNLIANGTIAVENITNSDLSDAINDAIDWYDKAQDALDEVQSLGIELKELSKTRFDNVSSEYEEFIGLLEHSTTILENQQDLLETQGYLASTALYENLITTEGKNIALLTEEYNALVDAMNKYTGEKYSETWFEMQTQINEVAESIQEAKNSLAEYNNELRQVKWDAFDRTRDSVQDLIDESEFLYSLLESNELMDENGAFNANGLAAQALLAQKYNIYMNQADAYAKEILSIDEEIANDPYNTTLLDRRQELLEAQQDAIKSANEEKEAIKDLIEDAYNNQLDSLQDIIDKYLEVIQTAKDAYDYEKDVESKVENIASLEKQLNAYQTDSSEEGMLRRQQLTQELKDAKDELEETEYDKLINDTEQLLDQVTTEFEDWMNTRLDNVDLLLQEIINASNTNYAAINDTLQTTANDVGYTITDTMSNIWNGSSGIREVMTLYQDNFLNMSTTINNSINSIGTTIVNILNKANELSEQVIYDAQNGTNTVSAAHSSSTAVLTSSNSSNNTSSSSNSNSRPSEDIFWSKKDSYPKSMLNVNTSIVDRLKYNDFDSSFNARAHYWESLFGGAYTGSYSQNVQMLDWLKQNGYASGIRRLHSSMNGYAWTNEDGEELIRTSDGAILTPVGNGGTVFNNKMTDTLWDFAKNPADYIKDYDTTTVLREGTSQTIDVGGFNIQVVANSPEEFAKGIKNVMAKDAKAQKMIQEIVLGQSMGNNTLLANKYL